MLEGEEIKFETPGGAIQGKVLSVVTTQQCIVLELLSKVKVVGGDPLVRSRILVPKTPIPEVVWCSDAGAGGPGYLVGSFKSGKIKVRRQEDIAVDLEKLWEQLRDSYSGKAKPSKLKLMPSLREATA